MRQLNELKYIKIDGVEQRVIDLKYSMTISVWGGEETIDMVVSNDVSIDFMKPVEIEIAGETEGIEYNIFGIYVLKSINRNMVSFESNLSFERIARLDSINSIVVTDKQ